MSNETNEPIAAILQEMRAYAEALESAFAHPSPIDLRAFAARIETAASLRNCDRFRTAEEAQNAFWDMCKKGKADGGVCKEDCQFRWCGDPANKHLLFAPCSWNWLFAPAEGGGHA